VQAVLARFPGAEIVEVRRAEAIVPPELSGDADDGGPELSPDENGSLFDAQSPQRGDGEV
jgi:hypothetical protein